MRAEARRWPGWFDAAPPARLMRGSLSATLSYAYCSMCEQRFNCRYDIIHDRFFCSEACWHRMQDRDAQLAAPRIEDAPETIDTLD